MDTILIKVDKVDKVDKSSKFKKKEYDYIKWLTGC